MCSNYTDCKNSTQKCEFNSQEDDFFYGTEEECSEEDVDCEIKITKIFL
jgi:hypothetical protein